MTHDMLDIGAGRHVRLDAIDVIERQAEPVTQPGLGPRQQPTRPTGSVITTRNGERLTTTLDVDAILGALTAADVAQKYVTGYSDTSPRPDGQPCCPACGIPVGQYPCPVDDGPSPCVNRHPDDRATISQAMTALANNTPDTPTPYHNDGPTPPGAVLIKGGAIKACAGCLASITDADSDPVCEGPKPQECPLRRRADPNPFRL